MSKLSPMKLINSFKLRRSDSTEVPQSPIANLARAKSMPATSFQKDGQSSQDSAAAGAGDDDEEVMPSNSTVRSRSAPVSHKYMRSHSLYALSHLFESATTNSAARSRRDGDALPLMHSPSTDADGAEWPIPSLSRLSSLSSSDDGSVGAKSPTVELRDKAQMMFKLPDSAERQSVSQKEEAWAVPLNADGTLDAEAILPLDAAIATGTLPNGMKYFVKPVDKNPDHVEIRLVCGIGSLIEEEHERGIAHILEHLCFHETKAFKHGEIEKWLESVGCAMGACSNAYTGFNETVYEFGLKSDKLAEGLHVLSQIASAVVIKQKTLDNERGIVNEERRLRDTGIGHRSMQAFLEVALPGCRHADRLPIGLEKVIKEVKPETLKSFYSKWYRPELQTVIVVGDFTSSEKIVRLIEKAFATPPPPSATHAVVPDYTLPEANRGVRFGSFFDVEMSRETATMTLLLEKRSNPDSAGYQQRMWRNWFCAGAIGKRLAKLARTESPPFMSARVIFKVNFYGWHEMVVESHALPGQGPTALKHALREVARFMKFGITDREMDHLYKIGVMWVENSFKSAKDVSARSACHQLISHTVEGETYCSPMITAAISRHCVAAMTAQDVNNVLKDVRLEATSDSFFYLEAKLCPGQDKSEMEASTQVALMSVAHAGTMWFRGADVEGEEPLSEWVEDDAVCVLVDDETLPEASTVVSERTWGATSLPEGAGSVEELRLGNGTRVLLMPTKFAANDLRMDVFFPHGYAQYEGHPEESKMMHSACVAAPCVSQSGLGDFDRMQADELLADKHAYASLGIYHHATAIHGGATASACDVEAMMQMLYLRMTNPRIDAQQFERLRKNWEERDNSAKGTVDREFREAVISSLHLNNCRYQLTDWNAADLQTACDIVKTMLGRPGKATIYLIGVYDRDHIVRMLCKYYGCLKDADGVADIPRFSFTDCPIPRGVITVPVYVGADVEECKVSITIQGVQTSRMDGAVRFAFICELLELRLKDELRERMGAVYSVTVHAAASFDSMMVAATIIFTCEPSRAIELADKCMETVQEFTKSGPTAQQVADRLEYHELRNKQNVVKNGHWGNLLQESLMIGWAIVQYPDLSPPGMDPTLCDPTENPQVTEAVLSLCATKNSRLKEWATVENIVKEAREVLCPGHMAVFYVFAKEMEPKHGFWLAARPALSHGVSELHCKH